MDAGYRKAFGRQIRTLRQQKGLSQEGLAAKLQVAGCDLTRSTLGKIEGGMRPLYPDEIKALKTVLDVPYDALFI